MHKPALTKIVCVSYTSVIYYSKVAKCIWYPWSKMPLPGNCMNGVTLVLTCSAINVKPTQKDQPLLSSKWGPQFHTHKWPWNKQKFVNKPWWDLKPRIPVLVRANSKLLLCSWMDTVFYKLLVFSDLLYNTNTTNINVKYTTDLNLLQIWNISVYMSVN